MDFPLPGAAKIVNNNRPTNMGKPNICVNSFIFVINRNDNIMDIRYEE